MSEQSAWPLPNYAQIREFLPPAELDAVLDWVLSNEQKFRTAGIVGTDANGAIDVQTRIALTTRDFDPIRPMLERRLREVLPQIEKALGCEAAHSSIELELAAHGDGAYYKPHIDMMMGKLRTLAAAKGEEERVLSAVYYFYSEPKAFSGGALRLFRFNIRPDSKISGPDDYVDVPPLRNSLVAFPPWVTHEVRPVHCPRKAFPDYRFALNCWFCRNV